MLNILNASQNCLEQSQLIFLLIFSILFIATVLIVKLIVAQKGKKPKYFAKSAMLTPTEIQYFQVLYSIIGDEYLIYPQINLASVIDKKGGGNFRTELFRNVDFGVFDYDYKPILLIEINDNSHFRSDRIERDEKVSQICKSAKLPLVTFWVKDGIDVAEMRQTLKKYLHIN